MPIPHNSAKDFFIQHEKNPLNDTDIGVESINLDVLSFIMSFLLNTHRNSEINARNRFVAFSIIDMPSTNHSNFPMMILIENRNSNNIHHQESSPESNFNDSLLNLSTPIE